MILCITSTKCTSALLLSQPIPTIITTTKQYHGRSVHSLTSKAKPISASKLPRPTLANISTMFFHHGSHASCLQVRSRHISVNSPTLRARDGFMTMMMPSGLTVPSSLTSSQTTNAMILTPSIQDIILTFHSTNGSHVQVGHLEMKLQVENDNL